MERSGELIRFNVAEAEGLTFRYCLYGEVTEERPSFSIECRCGGEIAYLHDVTSLRERAEEIFELFVRGRVTPTSAFDVIEDMIS